MSKYIRKKTITSLLGGASSLSEFWILGVLHELARHTVLYNGNVNEPRAGYFLTIIFCSFYAGRIFGNFFSVAFAHHRKFVLIAYLLAIPLIVVTLMEGLYSGAFYVIIFRVATGFLSAFEPAMCMLRYDLSKTETVANNIELKKEQKKINSNNLAADLKEKQQQRALARARTVHRVPLLWNKGIEFVFQYGSILLSGLIYNVKRQDLDLHRWVYSVIIILILLFFFCEFLIYEPQNVNKQSIIKKNFRIHNENTVFTDTKGLFAFLIADRDLFLETVAVKLYEATRVVDLSYMLLFTQTNPYYKGLFFSRNEVVVTVFVAALLGLIVGMIITSGSSKNDEDFDGAMKCIALVSIIIYPITATVINIPNYEYKNWALIIFGICEFIKFTLNFVMEGGLRYNIESSCRDKSDKFKAAGQLVEHISKFLLFAGAGFFITYMMRSANIEKVHPWNYTISFLILVLPLIISWSLIGAAQRIKKKENERRASYRN